MKVVILDGYVDEPSNFGVPPYISPYPRYAAGAIRDAGHTWEYVTIDRARAGPPLRGADVVRAQPDFPDPLTVELDTSKGCVRYVNKGCSFCIEPMYGKPKFRDLSGVLAEVRRLAELGAVNFRLGGQADFFSYQAIGLGSSPTPRINGPAIRSLLEGIRAAAPNLKVLHTDNGDPAMMLAHPDDAMAAMRDLVRLASPGNLLSFGLESADPAVTEANTLNIDADGCLEAIRMVNAVGRERGGTGMPILLPGLNFVAGLDGETRKTFDLNLAFLKHLLEEDLWVRRINIRQVRPVRREFEPTGLYREFRRFKEAVRTTIDHEMLRRVVPEGTVLRDVFLELQDGHVTYGRQIGTYPILVGLPYRTGMDRFVDVRVVSHGPRSPTAVEYPLDGNRAPLAAISALPGIGAKRAARIVRARPFDSLPAFVASLDDPAAGDRVAPFLGLAM